MLRTVSASMPSSIVGGCAGRGWSRLALSGRVDCDEAVAGSDSVLPGNDP